MKPRVWKSFLSRVFSLRLYLAGLTAGRPAGSAERTARRGHASGPGSAPALSPRRLVRGARHGDAAHAPPCRLQEGTAGAGRRGTREPLRRATSRDASRNATRLKARATGRCAIGCAPVGKPVQQPDSHGDATCRALVGGCRPEAGTSRSPTGDVPSLSPGAAASPSPLAPLGPAFLPAPLLLCPGSARSQRLRDEVQGVT